MLGIYFRELASHKICQVENAKLLEMLLAYPNLLGKKGYVVVVVVGDALTGAYFFNLA